MANDTVVHQSANVPERIKASELARQVFASLASYCDYPYLGGRLSRYHRSRRDRILCYSGSTAGVTFPPSFGCHVRFPLFIPL